MTELFYDREITVLEISAAYYIYRDIPDPAKVTVGERDGRILALDGAIKDWLAEQGLNLVADDARASFQTAITDLCAQNSDKDIAFTLDRCWLEKYDDRQLAAERVDYKPYEPFDLVLDGNQLYYRGELVRYFEDLYPLVEGDYNSMGGITHFDEAGTVDVHAVRDLTRLVYRTDGSYDPSGTLTGVEPYSQAEFDARDLEPLLRK